MYGALLFEPDLPGADLAVLFMHNEGYSTMCGHAIIALGRYAIDEGLVARQEPVTTVNIEALVEKGLLKNTKADVKILGTGELTKKLSVTAHSFSATAREKITAAGGSATALKEPKDPRKKKGKAKPKPVAAEEEPEVAETEDAAPAAEEE